MSEKLNLFQRINEVRKSISYLQKDKSVSTGSGSYRAITHDQVTGMVREHMVKNGIVSYPVLVESISMPKEVNANMETAKQFRYEATYDFTFVNVDDSADSLTIRIQAHAMDNADKAPGKALSYAKKYAVLKLFEIETGEDEESPYQDKEEFNIAVYISLLEQSENINDLQSAYMTAKQAAVKANDSSGLKAIAAKKDQLKTKFEAK
jgi:hypothetical protein